MSERIQTYAEFWPYYLGEHSKPVTRWFHFVGTQIGVPLVVTGLLTFNPVLVVVGLIAAYGPAWVSHFFIEKNRPATFKYPLWSLVSDFRMIALMWTGKLDAELAPVRPERR